MGVLLWLGSFAGVCCAFDLALILAAEELLTDLGHSCFPESPNLVRADIFGAPLADEAGSRFAVAACSAGVADVAACSAGVAAAVVPGLLDESSAPHPLAITATNTSAATQGSRHTTWPPFRSADTPPHGVLSEGRKAVRGQAPRLRALILLGCRGGGGAVSPRHRRSARPRRSNPPLDPHPRRAVPDEPARDLAPPQGARARGADRPQPRRPMAAEPAASRPARRRGAV